MKKSEIATAFSNGEFEKAFPYLTDKTIWNTIGEQYLTGGKEIEKFCTTKYNITFPLFEKINVNGDEADPLYKYLKETLPREGKNDVKWNFEKFLIDKNGKPVERFLPTNKPVTLEPSIEKLL